MNISCKIIEDLLPLYLDGVCSQDSQTLVRDHLDRCNCCKALVEQTQALPSPVLEPEPSRAERAIKKCLRKIKRHWWLSVLSLLVAIPLLLLGWNQYRGQGLGYTNWKEYRTGRSFMDCLEEGDYEGAYQHLNIRSLKKEWLTNHFSEETLTNIETEGKRLFCQYGQALEEAGGISHCKYIGISRDGIITDGKQTELMVFQIRFGKRDELVKVYVSREGVESFSMGGSFLEDPLARFAIWSEYLWQQYAGCYFDPEQKEYVYYKQEP